MVDFNPGEGFNLELSVSAALEQDDQGGEVFPTMNGTPLVVGFQENPNLLLGGGDGNMEVENYDAALGLDPPTDIVVPTEAVLDPHQDPHADMGIMGSAASQMS